MTASTVASKGYFAMTRFFKFTDETLLDILKELYYQLQTDQQKLDKNRSGYKRVLQQFISQYENKPFVLENCGISTDKHDASSLPDNGHNESFEKIYYGLPDDLQKRIKSLPKKYGKTKKEFAKDVGISSTTFSEWIGGTKYPLPSNLYLMAKTYGISIDSLLHPGASDEYDKKHPCKYTYGNTLRFIDQLQATGVIWAVPSWKFASQPTNDTHCHTKNPDEKKPGNMNYSSDGISGYLPGTFLINDDFLIRLITEIETEMSRPFDAPQSLITAQISYEMSLQRVNKFIAKYDNEPLLCYQKGIKGALTEHSAKWYKNSYGGNNSCNSIMDMFIDLDEMLEELRAVEIEASEALQSKNAIKQKT